MSLEWAESLESIRISALKDDGYFKFVENSLSDTQKVHLAAVLSCCFYIIMDFCSISDKIV